jgi:hypothetical protein
MDTKLTLWIDKETIQKIKELSKKKGFGLSEIVEKYFRVFLLPEAEKNESDSYTPLVRELSGVVRRLEEGTDLKDEYVGYLIEKYR